MTVPVTADGLAASARPVTRAFLERPAPVVAPELLNKVLVRRSSDGEVEAALRIVEVEAYTREDPASHSHRGPTARNATMFGQAGGLYVYFTYGMHHCANVVTAPGSAVLLRAAQPLVGTLVMSRARGVTNPVDIASGPAKLCQALGLDRRFDGLDLCDPRSPFLLLDDGTPPPSNPAVTTRVGISRGQDRPWRWAVDGHPHRSPGRPVVPAYAAAPLTVARGAIAAYRPRDLDQREMRDRILAFVDGHPDALYRTCVDGHLTASALVVDAGRQRVVLLEHRKLDLWLQPGGHADGDGDLAAVAQREATEETGIEGLAVVPDVVDVDVHVVDVPGDPAHLHLDVRFLVLAPDGAEPVGNHESTSIGWFRSRDLVGLRTDASVARLVSVGLRRARRLP